MKTKKILLINPPRYGIWPEYLNDTNVRSHKFVAFFPAGLLRIGSYFRDNGHKVSMINGGGHIRYGVSAAHYLIGKRRVGSFKDKEIYSPLYHVGMTFEDFKRKLQLQERPDEIYVTSFFTYQWETVHEVIKICKEVFPSAQVILGGIYPTLCPDHARTSQADVIHVGELKASNHCRLALDLLEEVPDYIILKMSRGCPCKCSYCAVPLLEGHAMRYREPEDLVDEIEEKIVDYNMKKVLMWESNILVNAESYLERMLDLIIRRKLRLMLSFPEGLNPGLLNESLLHKLKQVGVSHITLSVETSDKEMAVKRFRSIDKLPAFRRIIKSVKKAGIFAEAHVMAGMPGQEVKEVKRTVWDIFNSGCVPQLMPFTPIPGTREYMNCYQDIAQKGLEELCHLLWPCVKSSEDYGQLSGLHRKCLIFKGSVLLA